MDVTNGTTSDFLSDSNSPEINFQHEHFIMKIIDLLEIPLLLSTFVECFSDESQTHNNKGNSGDNNSKLVLYF